MYACMHGCQLACLSFELFSPGSPRFNSSLSGLMLSLAWDPLILPWDEILFLTFFGIDLM